MLTPSYPSALFSLAAIFVAVQSGLGAETICPDNLADSLSSRALLGRAISPEACSTLGGCVHQSVECRQSPIPTLDELAGEWQNIQEVYNHPSAHGFWGGVATTANILSFKDGTFPPLSQGGESASLSVGGVAATATRAKWYPYQVIRNGKFGGLSMTSTVRMGFEKNIVLLQLEIENEGAETVTPQLQLDLGSYWRYGPGTWAWNTPRPGDATEFKASFDNGSAILFTDSQSTTSSAFALSANVSQVDGRPSAVEFAPRVAPGSNFTIFMALAVGNKSPSVTIREARGALGNYSALWQESKDLWSQRYQDAFDPADTFFPGSLPVLVTEEKEISALWYQSIISILTTLRTNLPFPRVYSTAGPDQATTINYIWDTSLWSGILALLDPEFLKKEVGLLQQYGVYNGYAVDYVSEKLVGPWYSANDVAMFTTMMKYVNLTGDYEWLHSASADGSSNLAQMEARATHWKTLENPKFGLADYGQLSNLLEEVVTYTNMVPSLNAANVWMMDQYSHLLKATNNDTGATAFAEMAGDLAETILSLYAGPGTGYWLTTYPDGNRQAVKHIYDFDTISLYLTNYLNSSIKSDMRSFVHNDLYTGPWLRALSVSDIAANVSMRPDHGSNGAYTAWPALAAAGVSQLGDYDTMMTYLRSFSSVLSESTWAQCYQLLDPLGPQAASRAEAAAASAAGRRDFSGDYFAANNATAPAGLDAKARISLQDQGESYNANNGASFADVILTYVFGWQPDGKQPVIKDAGVKRGDFVGKLVGLRGPDGKFYEVDVGPKGVTMSETRGD